MRIALFAYTCSPKRGSEPGVGWAWMRMLARLGEIHVFTASRLETLQPAVAALPEADRIFMHQVEGPRIVDAVRRRWRRLLHLRYLLWLGAARQRALSLDLPFDLAWHATFANVWLGSTAGRLGAPLVLGPVGGGVGTPWPLAPGMGLKGLLFELRRNVGRTLGRWLNPRARSAWRRADRILVQNPETRAWLPKRHRAKAAVFTNATIPEVRPRRRHGGSETAVFIGRLVPWKGAWLALRAIAEAPGWRLVVCGTGPDERRLLDLAARLGISDRVDLRGWVTHEEVQAVLALEADVLLFPSLHDDGPSVVAEAIAAGVPVVCLDRGGPPVVGGPAATAVPTRGSVRATARALADVLVERRFASAEAVASRAEELERERVALELERLVDEVAGGRRAGRTEVQG